MALSRDEVLRELGEIRGEIDQFGRSLGGPASSHTTGGGPGDVFVASQGYKQIQNADARPQRWSTGPVTVSDTPLAMKGTLLESTVGGPGGGAVPPFYEPGRGLNTLRTDTIREAHSSPN